MDKKRTKVLLVEDSAVDTRFVKTLLGDGSRRGPGEFEVTHAGTLEAARLTLSQNEFDVLLLDLGLPECSGLETVLRIRSLNPEVAVVVLTASDDEEMAVKTLHQGAQDYLVKGQYDRRSLTRALRHAIERKRTTDELRQSEANNEALLSAVPDLILVVDKDGLCNRVKPAEGCGLPVMGSNVIVRILYEVLPE